MSVVDEVKSRLDIVDLIGQSVQLKKAGRIYKGLCPFHNERTPSFVVYPDQGTWHCFGACGTGGDVFTFVMKRDNLDFGDALRLLAERAGVELHHEDGGDENKRVLLDIHQAAAAYYHYLLLNHPSAQYAREYLERRHITHASIVDFTLGFSQNALTGLKDHLESKGFAMREIERAGLILANDVGGGYRDRFRGRLMFPIRNRRRQTIGFGARALSEVDQPKYLNSPETPLFSKSDILYGLDAAKEAIREANLAVIVEGYTDVIVAHQEGFRNVIAAMGTALTEKQLSQLQRQAKRYALALDADIAGAAATERGLELARAALTRKQVPVPIGPGMIGFEERLDAELLIIALPEGRDPDEVILHDPAHWRKIVEQATPLIDFYFTAQARELDLKTAHGKSEAVRRLLPVIGEMIDPVLRAHYTQELARLVQVDERALAQQVKPRAGGAKAKPVETAAVAAPTHPGAKYDEHLLALALAQPTLLSRVEFLGVDDFADGRAREIWLALSDYVASSHAYDEEEFLEGLSAPAREEGVRLSRVGKEFELTELEAAREIEAAAYRMRLQRDHDELTQMQYALADATPEEEIVLHQRADMLRQRVAESQRALNLRTVLRNAPPPTWIHEVLG
jgi:DNA primase